MFSFEPLPSVRNSLLEQISLNKFSNCTVFDFAASDTEREIQFYAGPPDHLGTSSFRRLENYQELIQVKCRKLDDTLRSSGKIHAIKIDVEGAEFLALKGAERLIQEHSPAIILEVTSEFLEQLGSSVDELNDYLVENKYRLLAITHKKLIELDHISDFKSKQFNLLAVHRDASSDWITSDLP